MNEEEEKEKVEGEEAGGLEALLALHGVKTGKDGKEPAWAIGQNRFIEHEKVKRTGVRQFIKPENALVVVRRMPEEGGTTHCILRGDFVLGDLIGKLMETGYCAHLRIATLGMSVYNAQMLARLHQEGKVGEISLVLSHYFEQVNKSTVYADCRSILEGKAKIHVMRSHAKIILMARAGKRGEEPKDWLVMEGSANLRSSDNLEQMTIFNDREVYEFHREWMDHVMDQPKNT